VATFETSLPSPAADGQEIYYRADSTNGVIWHLRYRNAFNGGSATAPWEYVGGSILSARDTSTRSTSSGTYQTTGSPSVTLPLAGDYEITFGAEQLVTTGASANQFLLGLHVNAATVAESAGQFGTSGQGSGVSYTYRHNGASASQAADVRYRTASSLGMSAVKMFITVRPVRVG
jgi:hypothetical protein